MNNKDHEELHWNDSNLWHHQEHIDEIILICCGLGYFEVKHDKNAWKKKLFISFLIKYIKLEYQDLYMF